MRATFGTPKRSITRRERPTPGQFVNIDAQPKQRKAVQKKYSVSGMKIPDAPGYKVNRITGKKYDPKYDDDLYDSLVNIVLNHKKDIRPFNIYTEEQARAYAEPRGLTVSMKDLDGDGINDVTLYNKNGQPVIINGYGLTESQYPYRHDYHKGNRIVDYDGDGIPDARGSYRDYLKSKWHYVQADSPWDDNMVSKEPDGTVKFYKESGYAGVRKPSKQLSPYQIFMKINSPVLKQTLSDMGLDGIQKVLKPMQIINLLYIFFVITHYGKTELNTDSYSNIKAAIAKGRGKKEFRNWFVRVVKQWGPVSSDDIVTMLQSPVNTGDGQINVLDYIFQDYPEGVAGTVKIAQQLKAIEGGYSPSLTGGARRGFYGNKSELKLVLETIAERVKERVRELVAMREDDNQRANTDSLYSAYSSPRSGSSGSPSSFESPVTPKGKVRRVNADDEEYDDE